MKEAFRAVPRPITLMADKSKNCQTVGRNIQLVTTKLSILMEK